MISEFNYQKPKLVAEIGCNHKGDINIAKELVEVAAQSKVDVVKFQHLKNFLIKHFSRIRLWRLCNYH